MVLVEQLDKGTCGHNEDDIFLRVVLKEVVQELHGDDCLSRPCGKIVCIHTGVSGATAPRYAKSQKISKKSLMTLIVISYCLKSLKISYANGRVSERNFCNHQN